ncbi:hypothetical protein [Pseudonocardia charpentierae]|uniref:Uncharacterized protein n=1 Tax=Pseudonocardia charpentierae TaxID=3075545 RepID=A0ABU2N2C1_9PSEU|nr:hypothetical protein [Pseudonocardia sp. DSM 45834]MDT0348066.1 hypothetical protein [Pseudonocardia sp. DSM 45834]
MAGGRAGARGRAEQVRALVELLEGAVPEVVAARDAYDESRS